MGVILINNVTLSPLKIVEVEGGDVLHAMKKDDIGFDGFGEAYFSNVNYKIIKAWKKHREMTMNIIVPIGEIRFVLFDDRENALNNNFHQVFLSKKNYHRLTIPPNIWFGFQGVSKSKSMLLNLANRTHNFAEADRKDIGEFNFDWSLK